MRASQSRLRACCTLYGTTHFGPIVENSSRMFNVLRLMPVSRQRSHKKIWHGGTWSRPGCRRCRCGSNRPKHVEMMPPVQPTCSITLQCVQRPLRYQSDCCMLWRQRRQRRKVHSVSSCPPPVPYTPPRSAVLNAATASSPAGTELPTSMHELHRRPHRPTRFARVR